MAGVGMGNCINSLVGISILVGLNGALETLVSQGFGSGDLDICAVYLNRARFILLVSFVFVFIILSNFSSFKDL